MWVLWMSVAQAEPERSVGVLLGASSADQSVAVTGRLRWPSGWQLGLRGRGARVTTGFVDGYDVDGTHLSLVAGLTVPLVRLDGVRVDLEVDAGVQRLAPSAGSAIEEPGVGLVADVSPMVTLPVGGTSAVRVGWMNVLHQQISPSVALDAQGALVRLEGVWGVSEDLQLTLAGSTGGVFGFDGDGGKYLLGATAGLRFVPSAARTFTNH